VILPDVNVLIYAFRTDSREHDRYKQWLENVVNGVAAYGISPQVLAAVIRISTHPRIFVEPSPLQLALQFTTFLLEQPHCQLVQPGPLHWSIFTDLCSQARVTGNLVQDAWFAALAIESGSEWITTDRDYARFEGLRWRAPF
jgi:toxin-antitoxin system PIN domain toxin